MKRLLSLFLIISIAVSLVGCKIDDLPFLDKDVETIDESQELKYKIDKVILSKGYQSIEPKVEVVKKSNDIRLLVSVGLLESSGVTVDQIVKNGNIIDIHIVNEISKDNIQLVVPQIILDLKNTKSINIDDMKFNIINENYKPLVIKLGVSDVINKVKSDFNVTANNAPEVDLRLIDEMLIWSITYNSIFDKDNPETPLVNLSVELDANSGEILQSTKGFISSYIDEGTILDYVMDKYILYRKSDIDSITGLETYSLWYYDIERHEKTRIYSTNNIISTAAFSVDFKNISVIENDGTSNNLFIITKDEKRAYKVLFDDMVSPTLVRWYDKNNIYALINLIDQTNIYKYNIKTDKIELVVELDKNIADLRINDNSFLLTENIENNINKNIYLATNLEELKFIDFGFNPRFANSNTIAYLKSNEDDERNLMHIYSVKDKKEYDVIDMNISSIYILPNDELFIVEKNTGNNDFTIHEYELKSKTLTPITMVNSDNIYYNKSRHLVYVDLLVPFESEKTEIIYSVDLTKLSSLLP